MLEPNNIYLGDCLELMRELPDKSVDAVITDPPYGIGFDRENTSMSCGARKDGSQRTVKTWNNPTAKGYEEKTWDVRPDNEVFKEIFRISKNQIIWGGNYFGLPISGGWLVWDKIVSMPSLSKCELAWTSIMEHIEIIHYLWAGYRKERPEERFHPTQKPVDVMAWAINFLPPDALILDPFLGSGTTAVACIRTGRRFIGMEIDPGYFAIAQRRIRDEQAQYKLALEG